MDASWAMVALAGVALVGVLALIAVLSPNKDMRERALELVKLLLSVVPGQGTTPPLVFPTARDHAGAVLTGRLPAQRRTAVSRPDVYTSRAPDGSRALLPRRYPAPLALLSQPQPA